MSRKGVTLALIAAFVVIGVTFFAGWMAWRQTRQAAVAAFKPHEEQIDLGAVVTRVRALNRLETASMRVVHVSTITQSFELIPNAIAGDELTFFAAGDVIAGVDLGQIHDGDVRREPDGTIVMRLPPPQVLMTRLDNRESRVISRKTGLLRRADINLESRARQYAEGGIRGEAVRRGILPMASQNAETKLAGFVHALGFAKVRFDNTPA